MEGKTTLKVIISHQCGQVYTYIIDIVISLYQSNNSIVTSCAYIHVVNILHYLRGNVIRYYNNNIIINNKNVTSRSKIK